MKVCIVSSHGGHLTELWQISEAFEGCEIFYITYDAASTRSLPKKYLFKNIGMNPLLMLKSLPKIAWILLKERPELLVSTGAEIAIPVFYIGKLLGCKSVFIESWTRVTMPTRTGKIVYPVANRFFVQWPQMLDKYGSKAEYQGIIL